ncbi:MAG: hypothetical protein J2O49_11720, partial [Sciscionella sp.]|nr:hypothetical protein [Sciscionella sp.]
TPDVALLHVAEASAAGDLYIDGDAGFDVVIACASRSVIASADCASERPSGEAAISRVWVDAIVHAPGGAWPTACYPVRAVDPHALQSWVGSKGDLAFLTK